MVVSQGNVSIKHMRPLSHHNLPATIDHFARVRLIFFNPGIIYQPDNSIRVLYIILYMHINIDGKYVTKITEHHHERQNEREVRISLVLSWRLNHKRICAVDNIIVT